MVPRGRQLMRKALWKQKAMEAEEGGWRMRECLGWKLGLEGADFSRRGRGEGVQDVSRGRLEGLRERPQNGPCSV